MVRIGSVMKRNAAMRGVACGAPSRIIAMFYAVRRSVASANCAAQRAAGVIMGKVSGRGLRGPHANVK